MSDLKVDPKEVLTYLNQLGYKNIGAEQLQNFVKDLKKLIKYENHKARDCRKIDIDISNYDYYRTASSKFSSTTHKSESDEEKPCIPESHFVTDKNIRKKHVQSAVQTRTGSEETTTHSTLAYPVRFYDAKSSTKSVESTKSVGAFTDATSQTSSSSFINEPQTKKKRPVTHPVPKKEKKSNSRDTPDSYDVEKYSNAEKTNKRRFCPSSCHSSCFSKPMKPRSAVIKCESAPKPPFPKCDPVTLHKYYQRQWRINKIPGENGQEESRFRWCFREKISCGPSVRLKKA